MKPLLYVVGDSISMHYGPHLETFVAPHFRFDRKRGNAQNLDSPRGMGDANGGDSSQVLEFLQALHARRFRADVFLLNCGLHDIKRADETGALQTSLETYRANLREIILLWRDMATHMAWVRTTWVDDARHARIAHAFKRCNADVQTFNAIADEEMANAQIPVLDLNPMSAIFPEPFCDHVHFTEEVRACQAAYLAGAMERFR